MKEYIFSTVVDGQNIAQNPEDAPAPTDLEAALKFYNSIERYYGHTQIRVVRLDHDTLTFKDVTSDIIDELAERDWDETFGWEQV